MVSKSVVLVSATKTSAGNSHKVFKAASADCVGLVSNTDPKAIRSRVPIRSNNALVSLVDVFDALDKRAFRQLFDDSHRNISDHHFRATIAMGHGI